MRFETYNPFKHFETLEHFWTLLQKDTIHGYFTSWGWVSTWLKSLPESENLDFVVGFWKEKPISVFLVGKKKSRRYGFLPTKTLYINCTGNPVFDQLYIEYNAILLAAENAAQAPLILLYLRDKDCDELVVPGADQKFVETFHLLDDSVSFYSFIEEETNSFFVDLDAVRENNMDFLGLLSANRRSQIRRSIKQYETDGGAVDIRAAQDVAEALAMFEELVVLHQQEWAERGIPGAFSNKYLHQFHRELIRSRFDYGEIQLLHVFSHGMTIGYLYNFLYAGTVLLYQSGFNYHIGNSNAYRPGIVSHYYAIVYNASRKMFKYDFLAGDAQYKRSLSTGSEKMYWLRLVKSPYRSLLLKFSRILKEKVTGR